MPDIDRERIEQYLLEIKESLAVLKAITTEVSAEEFIADSIDTWLLENR